LAFLDHVVGWRIRVRRPFFVMVRRSATFPERNGRRHPVSNVTKIDAHWISAGCGSVH
jgi:hypothetical protein